MNPNTDSDQPNQIPTPETPETNSPVRTPGTVYDISRPQASTPNAAPAEEESDVKAPELKPALEPAVSPKPPKKSGAKKYIAVIVLVVLLAAAAVGAVYMWQGKQLDDADAKVAELSSQLTAAKSAVKNAAAKTASEVTDQKAIAPAAANAMVPGEVDFDQSNARGQADTMYITGYVLPSTNLKEVWVEYGTSIDKLTMQTEHVTKELGAGENGQYNNMQFTLKRSSLQPGTKYYYRIAAKSSTSTSYSATAAFTALK